MLSDSGITIYPEIYSSRQPASKKKSDQPRAVKKKVAKKHSSQKLPWFSKGRSFLGKGKETSHFARERERELKQWSKFLNSGFKSRPEEDKEEMEEQGYDFKEAKTDNGERGRDTRLHAKAD